MREPDCIVPSLCVELLVLAWSAAVCDPGLRSSFLFLHCSIADDLLFFPFEFRPDLMCHARTHTHTHTSSVLQKTRRNSEKSNLFVYLCLTQALPFMCYHTQMKSVLGKTRINRKNFPGKHDFILQKSRKPLKIGGLNY